MLKGRLAAVKRVELVSNKMRSVLLWDIILLNGHVAYIEE